MEYLPLNKSVKIIKGDDINKDGYVVRIVQEGNDIFAVVQFNYHEYGIYKLSDIEITVCC